MFVLLRVGDRGGINFIDSVEAGGYKLNGTHQSLVYAYDVNSLSEGMHNVKKNAEALLGRR
jgi:hypothetical protein